MTGRGGWRKVGKECKRMGGEREKERGVEDRTKSGSERKKMHKQTLALGIDAISSVSLLMTNSIEKREEQKERSKSVSKSKREKQRG